MSGPKCIDIQASQQLAERRRAEARCRALESEYSRLEREFQSLVARLESVHTDLSVRLDSTQSIQLEAARLLATGGSSESEAFLQQSVSAARSVAEQARVHLESRIADLLSRFHQLPAKRQFAEQELTSLAAYVGKGLPPSWPEEEKARVHEILSKAQKEISLPEPLPAELQLPEIRTLENAERQLQITNRALAQARAACETEVRSIHARLLTQRLAGPHAPVRTLEDYLKAVPQSQATVKAVDDTLAKLDQLLPKLVALQDTAFWNPMLTRIEAIRVEGSIVRRRILYEALLLECTSQLKRLRALARWRADVDKLLDSAAAYKSTDMDTIVAELDALKTAAQVVPLETIRVRLQHQLVAEEKRRDFEQRRKAILESIREIGYDITESVNTASVQRGHMVIRKPNESDYIVEVNLDGDLMQTVLVREAESDASDEYQKEIDRQKEESWCSDHARFREALSARDHTATFKTKIEAGRERVKVRVVKDKADQQARIRATGGGRTRSIPPG